MMVDSCLLLQRSAADLPRPPSVREFRSSNASLVSLQSSPLNHPQGILLSPGCVAGTWEPLKQWLLRLDSVPALIKAVAQHFPANRAACATFEALWPLMLRVAGHGVDKEVRGYKNRVSHSPCFGGLRSGRDCGLQTEEAHFKELLALLGGASASNAASQVRTPSHCRDESQPFHLAGFRWRFGGR